MFKVGDKVRLDRDLTSYKCGINEKDLKELKSKVLTVSDVRTGSIEFLEVGSYTFSPKWLVKLEEVEEKVEEEKVDELVKFEAFLKDVVYFYGDDKHGMWEKVYDLVRGNDDYETIEKIIADLVEFYRTFNPKKRKLTMAELREIVGEDFEIVEG